MGILYQGKGENILTTENAAHLSENLFSRDGLQASQKFIYVSQDNVFGCKKSALGEDTKLYCDSATSCIIMIVTGTIKETKEQGICISHLSRQGRFKSFFEIIGSRFDHKAGINIYAAGANPAEPCKTKTDTLERAALCNATQVAQWVSNCPLAVNQATLRFGEGNPSIYTNNLDCFGINGALEVNNERLYLTGTDRDSTGGVQTLFCMYADSSMLHDAQKPFSDEDIKLLVEKARENNFEDAANMTDSEILKNYSSTPDYEVPWFASTIREAGVFTKEYKYK